MVFTLPAPIADLAYQNKAAMYGLLFGPRCALRAAPAALALAGAGVLRIKVRRLAASQANLLVAGRRQGGVTSTVTEALLSPGVGSEMSGASKRKDSEPPVAVTFR